MMEGVGDKMSDTTSSGTTSRGEHTTDKDNRLDVQSEYSGKAQEYVLSHPIPRRLGGAFLLHGLY